MTVPFLDLTEQYRAIQGELDEVVRSVIHSQQFVLGPEVEGLEREVAGYLGARFAVGCASGTDALLLPLRGLQLHPGAEVIVPSFTFFATAGAVANAGLRPVFCDVDPQTFNVTAETLEAVWTERTAAVIPVHLFGQMAPMDEILELAERRGASVMEWPEPWAVRGRSASSPPRTSAASETVGWSPPTIRTWPNGSRSSGRTGAGRCTTTRWWEPTPGSTPSRQRS
jgi:hypothetical protein